jgi:radical SAM superfamily enzyme YgiQ (UPF0313 family)
MQIHINGVRVALIAIYSDKFAMIGESHGISVLAGELIHKTNIDINNLLVLDMYAYDQDSRHVQVFDEIKDFKPNMIGFSCPYGSFYYLKKLYYEEQFSVLNPKPLVLFGGALPTYIPEKFLTEIDESAVVIRGEGEEAICKLVESLSSPIDIATIENISYCKSGRIVHNKRKQAVLEKLAPPFRGQFSSLIKSNAQIFVENSRGCAWGKCTFCSRNMYLDDFGETEYQRFPIERLKSDLNTLAEHGVSAITFADEDFCGSGLVEMQDIVDLFQQLHDGGKYFVFDVSMNVNSIYSRRWDCSKRDLAYSLLSQLKALGLRKIFLGVESGSAEQLRRYNKQHTPEEAVKAINILRSINIQIEIGFILFDPLCVLHEVKENIDYLIVNKLSEITSSLGSGLELRLHFATQYVSLLDRYNLQTSKKLYTNEYDHDTLNYPSFYASDDISRICLFIREANKTIRPLYYPLKSLSRYGEKGALGEYSKEVKAIVVEIRELYIQYIKECVFRFQEVSTNISTADILLNLETSIVNLYSNHRELLCSIAAEKNNPVLANIVVEYDSKMSRTSMSIVLWEEKGQ